MKIDDSKTFASEMVKKLIDNNLKKNNESIVCTNEISYKDKDYIITSYMSFFVELKEKQ